MNCDVARWRDSALSAADRSPRLRRLITRIALVRARKAGVPAGVIEVIVDSSAPLNRRLQMVNWAASLCGAGRRPTHFSPGDHFVTPSERSVIACFLGTIPSSTSSLRRDRLSIDDDLPMEDAIASATEVLRSAIQLRSTSQPASRVSVSSIRQRIAARDIATTLGNEGMQPFLMSGTLLGAVRDGDFMAHDYDVDLGLLPGIDVAEASLALKRVGFDVDDRGPWLVVSHSNGVSVDIFPHAERDGYFWHQTRIHEWWNSPFELQTITVGADRFWSPTDPDRYLTENYGAWKRPVPFYSMSFDTPNRVYRRNLDTLRFLTSLCHRSLASSDRWHAEASARELRDVFGIDIVKLMTASPLTDRTDGSSGPLPPSHS